MTNSHRNSEELKACIPINPPIPVKLGRIQHAVLQAVGKHNIVVDAPRPHKSSTSLIAPHRRVKNENENEQYCPTETLTVEADTKYIQNPKPSLSELTTGSSHDLMIPLESFRRDSIPAVIENLTLVGAEMMRLTLTLPPDALERLTNVLRKAQHISICASQNVEALSRKTGFESLNFVPSSFPELSFDQINSSVEFLGRTFSLPILITGMTGGIERGAEINERLARAAEKFDIPMGVGSQRIALDSPRYAKIFDVRKYAPDIFLIANLGASQLRHHLELDHCQRAVDMIEANALAIHINVLQEMIQEEGDRDFRHLLDRIALVCDKLSVPVIVKEVGSGIDLSTAQTLMKHGIQCIDVGGKGGTSWGHIEGLRSNDPSTISLGETFRDWGIPTAHSVASLRNAHSDLKIISTGGIRSGLMVAKAIAVGADMVGVGLPLFRAALVGDEALDTALKALSKALKITMLCTGSEKLDGLASKICYGPPLAQEFEEIIKGYSSSP